ncbi:recombinase family protein [Streptomyces endophyticus]
MTTSPARQRATVQHHADQLGFTLVGEAADLGVSARGTSPFERPVLGPWLRHPESFDAVIWAHVDRAVRSVGHMSQLIAWGCEHAITLVFGVPEESLPLTITPQADGDTVRRAMDLAYAAEQESRTISSRLTGAHDALRAAGRYGGGLVPFGYRKAPHASGTGWCLMPDSEAAALVRTIVDQVRAGQSLSAIARRLNDESVLVPRDRHAQLQGRATGGVRHGHSFDRFRWTSGTLSKVLRSPSLMGHRIHRGQTVLSEDGHPVLIGEPVLSEGDRVPGPSEPPGGPVQRNKGAAPPDVRPPHPHRTLRRLRWPHVLPRPQALPVRRLRLRRPSERAEVPRSGRHAVGLAGGLRTQSLSRGDRRVRAGEPHGPTGRRHPRHRLQGPLWRRRRAARRSGHVATTFMMGETPHTAA